MVGSVEEANLRGQNHGHLDSMHFEKQRLLGLAIDFVLPYYQKLNYPKG
jgi:hypothetical protein